MYTCCFHQFSLPYEMNSKIGFHSNGFHGVVVGVVSGMVHDLRILVVAWH